MNTVNAPSRMKVVSETMGFVVNRGPLGDVFEWYLFKDGKWHPTHILQKDNWLLKAPEQDSTPTIIDLSGHLSDLKKWFGKPTKENIVITVKNARLNPRNVSQQADKHGKVDIVDDNGNRVMTVHGLCKEPPLC